MRPPGTWAEIRERRGLVHSRRRAKLIKEIGAKGTSNFAWSGDLTDIYAGKFLRREFDIEINSLTPRQLAQLQEDIFSLSLENRTEMRDAAKKDSASAKKLLGALDRLQTRFQELSPDLWLHKAQKIECHPAFALLDLRESLETHLYLAELESGTLGSSKQDLDSRALCLAAIRIFLRWHTDDRPKEDRGITDAKNVTELLKLTKSEGRGKHAEFTSELAHFLDICTEELGKKHAHWRFDAWEPARAAKNEFLVDYLPAIATD